MSRKRTVSCLIPGEHEGEFWEFAPGSDVPGKQAKRKPTGDCVFAFGSNELFAVPLWVSSTDESVVENAVRMQLENRHIGDLSYSAGKHFDVFPVREEGSRTQVLAVVLAEEPESYGGLNGNLAGFDLAPRFYTLPGNSIGLWKEDRQWISAFYRDGRLVYFQALNSREFDEDFFSEIQCLNQWLHAADFIGKTERITIWNPLVDPLVADELGDFLGATAVVARRPGPEFPEEASALTPASYALKKNAEARQRLWMRLATVGLIIYMALMAFVMLGIVKQQRANAIERNWIGQHQAEAAIVSETQARWDNLQPAIDANKFPLELFHRVVQLLPEEGVRLTRFETDGDTILLAGEASSTSAAISWRAKLTESPLFSEYEWKFPAPEIQGDNRATFNAEAKPR